VLTCFSQLAALNRASQYFAYFDKDKSGVLERHEFKAFYEDLVRNKLTSKSFDEFVEDLDTDRDGKIQFNEYIDWLIRIKSLPIKVL
jgi:Ca2+-binding EF-hand superfamily protein